MNNEISLTHILSTVAKQIEGENVFTLPLKKSQMHIGNARYDYYIINSLPGDKSGIVWANL